MKSTVTLVGAGLGKDLITVKGLRALQNADIIFYDDLIDEDLLNEAKDGAEKIYVGKRFGAHSMKQEEISALLTAAAKEQEDRSVVRLKGGDGFVFGRGGEEMLALREAGVPCEIIPGVTSCVAVPEQMGIPVTHRGLARSFTVVTGHTAAMPAAGGKSDQDDRKADLEGGKTEPEPGCERGSGGIDYPTLARTSGTLLFLMGLHCAGEISRSLIRFGKPEDTPCAILSRGFQAGEERLDCTLRQLPECALRAQTPAIILVGPAAGMDLSSTVKRPLDGRHILVTGTKALTGKMAEMLTEAGASASRCVCLKTVPDEGKLDDAAGLLDRARGSLPGAEADRPGWLVFTSGNGVRIFLEGMRKRGRDIRYLAGWNIAAIGSGTADALERYGLIADFIPSRYEGQTLGRELAERIRANSPADSGEQAPVVLLRAKIASRALTDEFTQAGIRYRDISIYRTQETGGQVHSEADTVIFLSAAGVRACCSHSSIPEHAEVICIGPSAAEAFQRLPEAAGHRCRVPAVHTCDGILRMLLEERPHPEEGAV